MVDASGVRTGVRRVGVVAALAAVAALSVACTRALVPEPAAPASAGDAVGVGDPYHVGDTDAPAAPGLAAPTADAAPYAGRREATRVYFGDTHHHTANSGDAFTAGNRLTPEQAYRFARGEAVVSSTGVPAQLARPLDFLVITDHAEGLGVGYRVYEGDAAFQSDPTLRRWTAMLKEGGKAAADATNELIVSSGQNKLPGVLKDPAVVGPIVKSVWQQYTATAERFNEPHRFTALIGFEWSSAPDGNDLHRNVVFRDGKDRADRIVPFSGWQSLDPEKLWAWMARYEEATGGRLLAIPHNGNISNGRMFEATDFAGRPLTKDYAERRARFEVLQEVMQTKGNSETHPALSPRDEFADYGIAGWEYGNLTLTDKPATDAMRPTMYLRAGLMRGLEHEARLGANPFKFGLIGGSDVHTSLSAVDEDNFFGKHVNQEPAPARWEHVSKKGFGKTRYTWQYEASGIAGVWATANTREALWDAMKRREVYATSGTRMTVRFFGGYDYTAADAKSRRLAETGYAKGVPMGGDLARAPAGKAPTFLVAALKDPAGAHLDRVQIVKGWLDRSGEARERIYDVVWSGDRRPDASGRLPAVGDTVDVAQATWTDTIGAPELAAVWRDPDFDPAQRAFYYVRVIEIPTPRWTAYDQLRFGVRMAKEVPMKHQERAWTSPIWYAPS